MSTQKRKLEIIVIFFLIIILIFAGINYIPNLNINLFIPESNADFLSLDIGEHPLGDIDIGNSFKGYRYFDDEQIFLRKFQEIFIAFKINNFFNRWQVYIFFYFCVITLILKLTISLLPRQHCSKFKGSYLELWI